MLFCIINITSHTCTACGGVWYLNYFLFPLFLYLYSHLVAPGTLVVASKTSGLPGLNEDIPSYPKYYNSIMSGDKDCGCVILVKRKV